VQTGKAFVYRDASPYHEQDFEMGERIMQLQGIHHLTAVTANAKGNHDFYTRFLGLRLVKKTVNQDDVSAYHLFFADGKASPGSDITFFDWPVGPEQRGTNSISRTALRVNGSATLSYWEKRIADAGLAYKKTTVHDGRLTLLFEDPEGQRLALVDDGGIGPSHPWEKSPVPAEHQIRGLGPITLTVADRRYTDLALTKILGLEEVRDYKSPDSPDHRVHVYTMGPGGAAAEIHVVERQDLPMARQGAGAVHHVAFRTPDMDEYHAWAERLKALKVPFSGEVNRFYFHSLYFREPNGILFEIATDGPGFDADEPMESLGQKLALPPFLEGRRAEIEAGLKAI
jgi:glyoxalase family protein